MNPFWRNRFIIVAAATIAVVLGFGIASGNLTLAVLTLVLLAAFIFDWLTCGQVAPYILSITLVGYWVGNRGFAQASLLGSVPLLPAEFALASCLLLVFIQGASERRWPINSDWLSRSILIWCALSAIRLGPDLRAYGFLAIRDFATVYYSLFYFIAFFLSKNDRSRQLILNGIGVATCLLPPVFFASRLFPDVFLNFTFRGVPLIFYKPDLASAFAAVGLVWAFARIYAAKGLKRGIWQSAFILNLALIGYTVGRATMLSLAFVAVLFFLARERRFGIQLACCGFGLALASFCFDLFQGKSLEQTQLNSVYEHAISITDLNAQGEYDAALDSADNNRFRIVWWRVVVSETLEKSPMLGQGWGYDLGGSFARTYFGLQPDDFTARSPHNIFITLFGRTGFVGVLAFALVAAAFGLRVSKSIISYQHRKTSLENLGLWMAATILFVCACLGIVLEGPMGAIVFWTFLGLGHHALTANEETVEMKQAEPTTTNPAPNLTLPA